MKFPLFILFIFLLVSTSAHNIDSLLLKLTDSEIELNQYEKYEIYTKLGNEFHQQRDYASALNYFSQALSLAEKKLDKAKLKKLIGQVYVDSTNYDLALDHLNQSIELFYSINQTDKLPEVYNLKGMCYGLTNNLDEAINNFEISLKYNIEINDSAGIGLAYYNIGLANYFKGQYDKAIEYYIESANIRQHLTDTTAFVTSLTSIGELFRIKEEYANARIYYNKALEYRESIKSDQLLAYIYSELALIQKKLKNFTQALAYIDTAMTHSLAIEYKRGIATLISYKAGIYQLLNKTNDALELYNTVIEKYKEIGFEAGIVQANIAIAEIKFDLKEYANAMSHLDAVSEMATDNKILDECTQISLLRYKLYKQLNQYNEACIEVDKYLVLKDSLFNINKEEKINEIETKYQTAEKEKQIELLDKENSLKAQQLKTRKFLLVTALSFILLSSLMAFLLFRQNKLKAQLQLEQNRQKLLRTQMNPHFMYNALSAIQNFILQNNPIDSVTYISEFSSLMRLVLEGSRSELVLLQDEVKLVSNFLKLQQLRFDNSFQYSIEVDENINEELMKIPPMLSQPFIENAVEHGIRNIKNGIIKVSYSLKSDQLLIAISDNGVGTESTKNKSKSHKSMATTIANERISNIKKTLQLIISLSINSNSNEGTLVEIIVPQKKKRS